MPRRDWLRGSWVVRGLRQPFARLNDVRRRVSRRVKEQVQRDGWLGAVRRGPLRAGGTVLVAAVLTNVVGLWLLGKEGSVVGNSVRWALLAIGAVGMSQTGDWGAIGEGSWVIRRLRTQDAIRRQRVATAHEGAHTRSPKGPGAGGAGGPEVPAGKGAEVMEERATP